MTPLSPLHLFDALGVEIEYMTVRQEGLEVAPVVDQLIMNEHGSYEDLVRGPIGWSNELVNHVIELKTAGPAPDLTTLPRAFHREVQHINNSLKNLGAMLLPGGMHPSMVPAQQTVLWPHEGGEIYAAFDRIFGCRGHGWSNLQSVHINLPFHGDEEFGRLHAAVRLLLPLLPALAAASPLVEGRATGCLNNRLTFYRDNAIRVPSVTGSIVPEAVFSRKDYETTILARIYHDLEDLDPDHILQHEWVNARGAIARFSRGAIEIRLIDAQECPLADISLVALVVGVLRAICEERWAPAAKVRALPQAALVALMRKTMAYAHEAVVDDALVLGALGYTKPGHFDALSLWRHLAQAVLGGEAGATWRRGLGPLLEQGPLAARILRAMGRRVNKDGVARVYRQLAESLAENVPFSSAPKAMEVRAP